MSVYGLFNGPSDLKEGGPSNVSRSLQTTQISSAIKRANQRIAQLGKTYGRNSSVYKQEAGKFLKGAYKNLVTESVSGVKHGRNISAGGNLKFDTRAIMKLVKAEGGSSKVNRLLSEIAGVRITEDGEVVPVKGGGLPTVTELTKRTEKKLERWGEDPGDYNKQQIRDITEQLAEFSENFQTTYEVYMAKYGEAEARKDSTIQALYGEYRDRRLTYRELQAIKDKMDNYNKEASNDALDFENENNYDL